MASLSLYLQLETNLMSNRKVIELLLQSKSAKAHGKNNIKVKAHTTRGHLNFATTIAGNFSGGDETTVYSRIAKCYERVPAENHRYAP